MMTIPLVDLKAQYTDIKVEIDRAIQRVLTNTSFILGSEVRDFENAFARYCSAEGAVGVASGTAALQLAIMALGVQPGDEIITTAHTFIATAEAISQCGARPVFVDIDPKTYNLDPARVEAAITQRTRGIIPVHLYGQPADLDALTDLAKRKDLWMIEDAAQAHGAEYRKRRVGSIGRLACFSFYPGKNLGAYGDAGAVTGNDSALLDRVRKLRDHGRMSKYEHDVIGYGERLDALQAAVLSTKLPHLERWTEARRSRAARYRSALAGSPVQVPHEPSDVRHVYHLFVIRTERRDELRRHLTERGIDSGVHYPVPLHRQPAYLRLGYGDVSLPHTELAAREVLSLPIYPELRDEQVDEIAAAVREFFR